jgi:hypothetical protein
LFGIEKANQKFVPNFLFCPSNKPVLQLLLSWHPIEIDKLLMVMVAIWAARVFAYWYY